MKAPAWNAGSQFGWHAPTPGGIFRRGGASCRRTTLAYLCQAAWRPLSLSRVVITTTPLVYCGARLFSSSASQCQLHGPLFSPPPPSPPPTAAPTPTTVTSEPPPLAVVLRLPARPIVKTTPSASWRRRLTDCRFRHTCRRPRSTRFGQLRPTALLRRQLLSLTVRAAGKPPGSPSFTVADRPRACGAGVRGFAHVCLSRHICSSGIVCRSAVLRCWAPVVVTCPSLAPSGHLLPSRRDLFLSPCSFRGLTTHDGAWVCSSVASDSLPVGVAAAQSLFPPRCSPRPRQRAPPARVPVGAVVLLIRVPVVDVLVR